MGPELEPGWDQKWSQGKGEAIIEAQENRADAHPEE